jgi:hypothetical protein
VDSRAVAAKAAAIGANSGQIYQAPLLDFLLNDPSADRRMPKHHRRDQTNFGVRYRRDRENRRACGFGDDHTNPMVLVFQPINVVDD